MSQLASSRGVRDMGRKYEEECERERMRGRQAEPADVFVAELLLLRAGRLAGLIRTDDGTRPNWCCDLDAAARDPRGCDNLVVWRGG